MNDTSHAAAGHAPDYQPCPFWLRLMAGIAFSLIGLALLAHGLLLIGNYFTYSDWRLPPKLMGKVLFLGGVGTTFAVSWLSLAAGWAWFSDNGKVLRRTATALTFIVGYLALFYFIALR